MKTFFYLFVLYTDLLLLCTKLQAEWEALEIITHEWRLDNVEEKLMEEYSNESFVEEKDKHV